MTTLPKGVSASCSDTSTTVVYDRDSNVISVWYEWDWIFDYVDADGNFVEECPTSWEFVCEGQAPRHYADITDPQDLIWTLETLAHGFADLELEDPYDVTLEMLLNT